MKEYLNFILFALSKNLIIFTKHVNYFLIYYTSGNIGMFEIVDKPVVVS